MTARRLQTVSESSILIPASLRTRASQIGCSEAIQPGKSVMGAAVEQIQQTSLTSAADFASEGVATADFASEGMAAATAFKSAIGDLLVLNYMGG